jgi:uncharacterized protein YdaU (DUF1376 family)
MHYYKFNIADWHLATSHLSLEEEAIYFRLINYYYDTESPIPVETQSVIRRLRLGSYSEIAGLILKEFFSLESDGWHHKRCDDEISQYHDKAEVNQANGKKGGRPKKTQTVSKDNPDITLTNNQEPITKNHIYTDSFEKFWSEYPNKTGKGGAFNSWKKIKVDDELLQAILKSIALYKQTKQVKEGYIKNPQTWLNNRCWEDEVIAPSSNDDSSRFGNIFASVVQP